MTFGEARKMRLPFGIYEGKLLDEVAETDDGLRYLDWLVGCDFVKPSLRDALTAYLSDKAIAEDLAKVVRR